MIRLSLFLCLLFASVCAFAQEAAKPRVIVGSFDSRGSREDDILRALEALAGGKASFAAREVRDQVTTALVNSRRYEFYSARDLERLMRENRDLHGPQGIMRLGELTGARYYLSGNVVEAEVKSSMNLFKNFEAVVRVSCRVIDLQTGATIKVMEGAGRTPKVTLKKGEEGERYDLSNGEKEDLLRNSARTAAGSLVREINRLRLEGGATTATTEAPAPTPAAQGLELEVGGFESLGQSRDFERALEHVAGVDKVERLEYRGGVAKFRLHGKLNAAEVGEALEKSDRIAALGLRAVVDEEKAGWLKVSVRKK